MPTPTLYQYQACPFCWKIKALLDYKQITYRLVEVNPLTKKEIRFSKDYKKVPIYVDKEGKQVNDSNDIMRHIEKEYPETPVFSLQENDEKKESFFMNWSNETLAKALPPLLYQNFSSSLATFDYITEVSKFGYFTQFWIKFVGGAVMTLVAKKLKKNLGISDPGKYLTHTLEFLEKALGTQPFLAGKKVSGADFANYGILRSVQHLQAFQYVKANSKVYTWYQSVENLIQERKQKKEKACS